MAEIKQTVDEKIVMIPYIGPIIPKGGIYGPVPAYKADVKEISLLITKGYPVSEVLADGTYLELDLTNYNIDHNGDKGEFLKSVQAPQTDPIPVDDNGVIGDKADNATGTPATTDDKTGGKNTVTATPAATPEKGTDNSTVIGGSTSGNKAEKLEKK